MISKTTIDNVFETARVEEVIGDFVQLKKSGSNFKGLSPFTDERTPSFMVSPVKQIWKDFSSGKGGNVVAFLMEHEHFTYPEAIKYLAKKYGIEIEETEQTDEQKQLANERESLYLVSEFAKDYFVSTLHKTEEGKAIGLTYFKERGFTEETIKKFELGYSPNEWSAFTDTAIKKGYKLEFLEKTGLTIVKEEKQFDRFKGRVIFPIKSMSGRILGFGGRILTSDKKAAKYLNSPESDIYHKSKVLYGIYQAKQTIAKEDNCFLVEGYTDVIQFNQTGIANVVSSSGTALTPEQIRLINRLTRNITVLFDGDAAGLRASLRGVDLILEQGMNVKVCTFPEGEDPDSFARENSLEMLRSYLEDNSQDFINFKASLLASEAKDDPIRKAETIRDMVVSISKIPDAIKQEVYIKECSRIMDISEEVLFNTLAQMLQKERRDAAKRAPQPPLETMGVVPSEKQSVQKVDIQFELERKIIELLLLYGTEEEEFEDLILETTDTGEIAFTPEKIQTKVFEKIYLDLQDDEIEFMNEGFRELYYEIINKLNQEQDLQIDALVNQLQPEKAETVTHILMEEEKYSLHNWERKEIYVKQKNHAISQVVSETILNLRRHLVNSKIEELAKSPVKNGEYEDKSVLENISDYTILRDVLSEKLRRVL
ncbi:MAG: DNA primase [Bacteroidia bacterium]|nr:DNA primase [Bacteroidia bacterium]MBT8275283.1 DNA primase [Bacteroidia bacterium]NNJ83261.1 DNA primase [Flavobacteriaceae bacterium]NNK53315.1 DNA primase [Flavobacteriaceae bacterium]NNM08194.1 DNA primase [Flavobacteriaceae bacterium]